jgi:phospholipid/cholesterol/gamma-HCH transport system substrate-binding protein
MDLPYKQEITVGGLVLAGIALFIVGTMWLSGRSLNPRSNEVRVQFSDVGNLKRGNQVKVSGVQLGTVEDIEFVDVGKVLIILSLDRRITPRVDATARLVSVGLIGDASLINFDPGREAERLPPDRVIMGQQSEGITELGAELGDQARVVLEGIGEVANKRLADDMHNTLVSIQRLANVFSNRRDGPTAELAATAASLQQLSRRLDSVLGGPALDRTVSNLDSVTVQLRRLTDQYAVTGARLDSLLQRVNRGEGTLGRLATDSTLYFELRDLTATVKAFVDTLRKNPGKITVQFRVF